MVNQYGQFIPDFPGQQPYQYPAYMRYISQQQQHQNTYQGQQYQQQITQQAQQQPASRMTEVFAAANEKYVLEFPVAAGTTALFVATDDSFTAIKEASVTGQVTIQFYDKRPPAPPEKPFDPAVFVTREEFEQRLSALPVPAKRPAKKEEIEA